MLMFGREQQLPIDSRLGMSDINTSNDWIRKSERKVKKINKEVVNKLSKVQTDVKGVQWDNKWEAGSKVGIIERRLKGTSAYKINQDDYKIVEYRINLKLVWN